MSSTSPWVTRARSPRRNGGNPQRATSASASQNPALCRVAAYSGPGLPRPTTARKRQLSLPPLGFSAFSVFSPLGGAAPLLASGLAGAPPSAAASPSSSSPSRTLRMSSGSATSVAASGVGAATSSARGGTTVAYVQRVADLERVHVELDAIRDVLREHLDLHLARHLVEHAAGVPHAVRVPHEVHRHLELDLLRRMDLIEIHVNDVGPDGVALDLANQCLHRLAVHRELDDRARGLDPLQRLLERLGLELEGLGVAPVAVDHRRDLAVEARLPRGALASRLARARGERNGLGHSSVLSR